MPPTGTLAPAERPDLHPPMSPTRSDEQLFDAVLERVRRTVRAAADQVVDFDGGFAASTPSLSVSWTLNRVHLTRATSEAEVAGLAERHQSESHFRHVIVEHPDEALLEACAAAGWTAMRDVVMVLGDFQPRVPDTRPIVELTGAESAGLNRMWIEEDHSDLSDEGVDQLVEMTVREGRHWEERAFGIRSGGRPVAMTKLRIDDEVAWVEDVYTDPAERRQGHGRRLVQHVCGLATESGRDLTCIIADASDWPQHLYAEIGFRPVGFLTALHRRVRTH